MRDLGLQPAELEKLRRQAPEFELAADECCIRNLVKCRSWAPRRRCPCCRLVGGCRRNWLGNQMMGAGRGDGGRPSSLEPPGRALEAGAGLGTTHCSGLDLHEWCRVCLACLKDQRPPKLALTRSEHVRVPFDTVQVDLQGPIVPPSTEGWRYVLTVVCTYTRYASLRGTRTKSKQEVAKVIVDVFFELGTFPRVLVSDRGAEFINDLMGEVLSVLRVFRFSAPPIRLECRGWWSEAIARWRPFCGLWSPILSENIEGDGVFSCRASNIT